MPTKSKEKGKNFEREVCAYLSKLYESSFTRAPSSGAYTGGKNSHRKDWLTEGQVWANKGDIIPPDNWNSFNAECKAYKQFPFHKLLSNEEIPMLEEWFEQTLEAAEKGDCSIIFMKFNNVGRYVAFLMPQDFETTRHIDYIDKNNNLWRITGFIDFFNLNKSNLSRACISK